MNVYLILTIALFLYFMNMILINIAHKEEIYKYEYINTISSIISIITSFVLIIFITELLMISLALLIILIGYYVDNDVNKKNTPYIKLYSIASLLLFISIIIQLFL